MAQLEKLLARVLSGSANASLRFADARTLLGRLGFSERIRGSHHIFTRPGIVELVDLQPQGGNCKPYQVKQIREVIIRNHLSL